MGDVTFVLVGIALVVYVCGIVVTLIGGITQLALALDSREKGFPGLAAREAAEGRQAVRYCWAWPALALAGLRRAWRL